MKTAPPTAPPGTADAPPVPPVDTGAVASLVLGVGGIILPLVNVAAIIVGAMAVRRLRRPESTRRGRGLAWGGIALGAAGIVVNVVVALGVVGAVLGVRRIPDFIAGPDPAQLHRAMRHYADDTGVYPRHVAEIFLVQWPSMLQLQAVEFGNGGPARLAVGEYTLGRYDGLPKERRRLREAIDGLDLDAPVYRFGDCRFVRFEALLDDDRLVAGWSVKSDGEVRVALEDGGEHRDVDPAQWEQLWRTDAAARAEHGLPPLAAPEYPTPESPGEDDAAVDEDDVGDG